MATHATAMTIDHPDHRPGPAGTIGTGGNIGTIGNVGTMCPIGRDS